MGGFVLRVSRLFPGVNVDLQGELTNLAQVKRAWSLKIHWKLPFRRICLFIKQMKVCLRKSRHVLSMYC